jgi:hypothetical protein
MDLIRTGWAHARDGHLVGGDRYLVHVIRPAHSHLEHLDGSPVDQATAGRVGCDCSSVEHHVGAGGEPLWLGRKARTWSTGQRRAVSVRDRGRCRFPGCEHTRVDIHHLRSWEDGGFTDIDNAMLCCPRHHTLLHDGFTATGDANHTLTFTRPDHTILATSPPPCQPTQTG